VLTLIGGLFWLINANVELKQKTQEYLAYVNFMSRQHEIRTDVAQEYTKESQRLVEIKQEINRQIKELEADEWMEQTISGYVYHALLSGRMYDNKRGN
jgi:hypothetical protein